ncbi:hypothetical protein QR680_003696 [Steinernema hermaphroditum]|uniref:Uncharacterized protein n=1 Tax=Steinernema hermaphroditum TaxID=289476 RepID=A0AA39HNH3_9BILA|nr:hypothetical protein QR680_003696 [Steinernema hermaphroditum]
MTTGWFPVIVGLSYFIISAILLVLNGLLLIALFTNKDFNTSTYRIIKTLCFSCILQLVPFAFGGIMTISQSFFHVYLDRVLGIIIESSWLFYVCISLTLAVDRFLIFVHPSCTTLATILLGSSWLFWISTMVVMSLPGFGYTYKHPLGYYLWMWNAGSGSAVVAEIEPFFDVSVFIVIFVMYAIVVRKIMQLKRTATSSSYRTELRICVVAAGSFIYETLFIAVTFWMPFDVLGEKEMYVVLNVIWMIDCGMFASLTLVFNTVLRRKVILLVKGNDVIHVSSNRVT